MNTRPVGEQALLVETGSSAEAQALRRALVNRHLDGLLEAVPGQSSLLVVVNPLLLDLDALATELPRLLLDAGPAASESHELAVRYDGEDLAVIARRLNMDAAEVVRRHAEPLYTVAFLGFAPGFAYLTGLDPLLRLPRRADPRTRVPAGSLAMADEFTGIYPQATPGGWHLLGRCEVSLFDAARSPPALLAPGDRVRFKALP